MSITPLIEYEDATEEVRSVYEDIMATRGSNWINNFWKALATQPELLKRTWTVSYTHLTLPTKRIV